MFGTITLLAALSTPALAADATAEVTPAEPAIGVDIEVDPLAYAIGGASIHGGLHVGRVRFDLGVFSLVLPEALHGNPGFHVQGHGYGLKTDLFAGRTPTGINRGLHVGAQLDLTHQTITHEASDTSALYRELATGGRVGYRIQHTSGFYVNPWVGVVYRIDTPTEVALGGDTFTQTSVTPFPTVHVGWRL